MLVQIGHVFGRGEFGVSHIEEVVAASQLAEEFPGVHVRLIVGRVAAGRTEVDRHTAVVAEREDVDQLFQVGTMVLVVAPGNGQGASSATEVFFGSVLILAVEGDRGGVVVQLVERDLKFANRVPDHGQHEGPQCAAKQAAQRPADAVVAEGLQLVRRQAQQVGRVAGGPLAHAVQGLTRDEEISQQHQQGFGRRYLDTLVLRGQVLVQPFLQAKPLDEVVDDRQGSDLFGAKDLSARARLSASTLVLAGMAGPRGFSFSHRLLSLFKLQTVHNPSENAAGAPLDGRSPRRNELSGESKSQIAPVHVARLRKTSIDVSRVQLDLRQRRFPQVSRPSARCGTVDIAATCDAQTMRVERRRPRP